MKYATGLFIAVVSVFGCSYTGASEQYVYNSGTSCADVWGLSGIEQQSSYRNGVNKFPEITANMKKALIESCENAKEYGEAGGAAEDIMMLIVKNNDKKLPEEAIRNRSFMMLSGWKIGQLNRK